MSFMLSSYVLAALSVTLSTRITTPQDARSRVTVHVTHASPSSTHSHVATASRTYFALAVAPSSSMGRDAGDRRVIVTRAGSDGGVTPTSAAATSAWTRFAWRLRTDQ
jgi:hypothetical protein